jgi:hypothetical protein
MNNFANKPSAIIFCMYKCSVCVPSASRGGGSESRPGNCGRQGGGEGGQIQRGRGAWEYSKYILLAVQKLRSLAN